MSWWPRVMALIAFKTKKSRVSAKSTPPPSKRQRKSSTKRTLVDDDSDTSPKASSRKKKNEKVSKESTPKKSASTEKTVKKVAKGKDKTKEGKLRPTDDNLRDAICQILKQVDFNTATFTDILKLLAGQFDADLSLRKSAIKLMIQEELTKLADEADEEDEEGDPEKDETQTAKEEEVEV
ncbi:hypothetical protein C1H46_028271 [Malus baccata]|uniref:DEK-C domain-containing protein n=1 Tax=Malus baccata TaxID=106549 RepID=A0A540LI95_MALBA|nr:hypothetical protein C1H46_028271 [Malus baccata]